jgi:hypothetical protein
VANTFIKAGQIVEAAALLLQREIVLPRLVWTQPSANFVGALNDTITLRVPAVLTGRTRVMRSTTALTADDLTETSVPVQLDTHAYSLLNITDEQLTLDIRDFAAQVLAPQMRAVGETMEDVIVTALDAATPTATDVEVDTTAAPAEGEAFAFLVSLRKALNDANVPRDDRVLVVGSALESWILRDPVVASRDATGNTSALADATIGEGGRAAGFRIVGSNAVAETDGYAFHRTAIAFGNVAPAVPAGASMGARTATEGMALRYLRDYNPTNSTGPVDRSLVDAFVGAASVDNASNTNDRIVKVTAPVA